MRDRVVNVLWPSQCAGCGRWDEVLCHSCRSVFLSGPGPWELAELPIGLASGPAEIPLFALGRYAGVRRAIVLALKHGDVRGAEQLLRGAGRRLGVAWARSALAGGGEVVVVPAPSSWGRRLRGREVVVPLAEGVAEGIRSEGGVASVVECVGLRLGVRGQRGRGRDERQGARAGTMRVRGSSPEGGEVLLVDDVVTTGATIGEMWRVLDGRPLAVLCMARA